MSAPRGHWGRRWRVDRRSGEPLSSLFQKSSIECMATYQYRNVYSALRARIEAGEFAVGDRLPSISALQEQYGVRSLSTIRSAQELLAEDGMVRTEQGRGVFVTSTESMRSIDVDGALGAALEQIGRARAALATQRVNRVTFDLDPEGETYFVLSDALTEWADSMEARAREAESLTATSGHRWADLARELLGMVEEALDRTIGPSEAAAPDGAGELCQEKENHA